MFRTTIEVMLRDGILTREEKRLIIKLANALGLSPDEPAEISAGIRDQRLRYRRLVTTRAALYVWPDF